MRDFLSLSIGEKSARASQAKKTRDKETLLDDEDKEQEENEKTNPIKLSKNKTALPKQTAARRELKKMLMKRENITKDSKHDFISMERQKAVLELSLMTKRAEIQKMDKAIAKEEKLLKELETKIDKDNHFFEECLKEHEKKSVEARTFFEREARSKQQKTIEIKKLMAEIATIDSDLEKIEETLVDYKRYKELLFNLSPPEWQEAQRANAPEKKDLVTKESEDNPLVKDSSSESDTELTNSKPEFDISQYEEEPQLYFTDPQQLLDLLTELTEQNLSLIQNSARVEETLEELRAAIKVTQQKMDEDEEMLALQINSMKQRIDAEKARGNKLKQKVELHVSLNTQDQDVMLGSLGEKVSEVHQCCVDDRITNLSTLEKLASIENSVSVLLQNLESIPEESLKMMRKIKASEKRARQREEKLREQKEKQKERMRRYLERSITEPKKIMKKKPMPKYVPVVQKVKVTKVKDTSAEDELQAYLFPSDDSD